jgi:hypothetical protein
MAINMFEGARRIAKLIAVSIVVGFGIAACEKGLAPDDETFTLYQSTVPQDIRLHVATFDVKTSMRSTINIDNCERTARLTQAWFDADNPSKGTRKFWCEKGRYKK